MMPPKGRAIWSVQQPKGGRGVSREAEPNGPRLRELVNQASSEIPMLSLATSSGREGEACKGLRYIFPGLLRLGS